jgi:glutamine amidotransferase
MDALLIDYGGGNLHSVHKALLRAGLSVERSDDPARAAEARALVLPGQGHFGQVMRSFLSSGFEPVVRNHIEQSQPFLGICVGLQLLLERSEEAPDVPGLGILPGTVRRFPSGLRVPQMGWNRIRHHGRSPLLEGVPDGSFVYFANSYYADLDAGLEGARTTYGDVVFSSAVSSGALHATQFHPEKSQQVGLTILANFNRLVREALAAGS